MKFNQILMLMCMFYLSTLDADAQVILNREIPPGMEAVQIGGSAWLIIPEGAKTRKVGAQIIVEGSKEYMSRRFFEMDERLKKMEKAQEALNKEVSALRNLMADTPKTP